MKKEALRMVAGLGIAASLWGMTGAWASPTGSQQDGRCGKGYAVEASEDAHGHSWHGLALASMLDVILPPLTERVVSGGEPKDRVTLRSSGLAKAERGLLAGVLSAAVSAGLAAIGSSLDAPVSHAEANSSGSDAVPAMTEDGPGSSCPEGEFAF